MVRNKNISVIIPAAGNSIRLNAGTSKQFILLSNKPLLFYLLDKFLVLDNLQEIIVVSNDISGTESLLDNYGGDKSKIKIVKGGELRQDSVLFGFNALNPNTTLVIIHDVARPLFDLTDLEKCINCAEANGACVLACPVSDTIKKAKYDNDRLVVETTIDRSNLYAVQTPQVFQYKLLGEVYKKYCEICVDKPVVTDEAKLVELLGGKVDLVIGKRSNIKITYPEDLEIALALLRKESKMSLRAE